MSDAFFISDLHLSSKRPAVFTLFLQFLQNVVKPENHLYILGDLFDVWIGDDDLTPPIPEIILSIRRCVDSGAMIYLMHGNRDFLIGERFASATGCMLLEDPAIVDLQGIPTLLMHGDLLCSDDTDYHEARTELRKPDFIEMIMSKSIAERHAIAAEYRRRSCEVISLKPADIMDVNQQTVERYMLENQVVQLIHGHTHRPAVHEFELEQKAAKRIVLADWHEHGGCYLWLKGNKIETRNFHYNFHCFGLT